MGCGLECWGSSDFRVEICILEQNLLLKILIDLCVKVLELTNIDIPREVEKDRIRVVLFGKDGGVVGGRWGGFDYWRVSRRRLELRAVFTHEFRRLHRNGEAVGARRVSETWSIEGA